MFQGELAAQAAVAALHELIPVIVEIAKDTTAKAEDRLHACHILISISRLEDSE